MSLSKKLGQLSNVLGGHFPGWLVVFMMVAVLVQVLTRYVSRHPFSGADEFSGLLSVVIGFLGLGYTWRQKRHIRLDFAVKMLPERVAAWIRLLTLVAVLFFAGLLSKVGLELSLNSWRIGSKSYDIAVPLAYPQFALFVGSVLFGLWVLVDVVRTIAVLATKDAKRGAAESLASGTGGNRTI